MSTTSTFRTVVADPSVALSTLGLSAGAITLSRAPPATVAISLTEKEAGILRVLRDAAVEAGRGTEVRIVGGWVRDKLLGRPSNDIDVALDTMTGVEFAEAVNAHLGTRGEAISGVGVISANPAQSKHLETACSRVHGEWIDFVGLRAEVYDGDSRIPKVVVGTPTQDALRRDFTFNALFFNVTRETVEDLTGRGFDDLAAGVVRTPVDPLVTFRDDPLRVLRAVRFATRLNFTLAPELRVAASDAAVAADLSSKVSRERVGIELTSMLEGVRPLAALRALHDFGLLCIVFELPVPGGGFAGSIYSLPPSHLQAPLIAPPPLELGDALARPSACLFKGMRIAEGLEYVCTILGGSGVAALFSGDGVPKDVAFPAPSSMTLTGPVELFADSTNDVLSSSGVFSREAARLLLASAVLLPLSGVYRRGATATTRSDSVPGLIALESLKWKRLDAESLSMLHAGAVAFSALLSDAEIRERIILGTAATHTVVTVGTILRKETREHWRGALILSLASHISSAFESFSVSGNTPESLGALQRVLSSALVSHASLAAAIVRAWRLDGVWTRKPLLDGHALRTALGANVKGTVVGALMEEQARWMMVNPDSIEALTLHLKQSLER